MKFKNTSNKVINMKVKDNWVSVKPGKNIDVQESHGINQEGLTFVSVAEVENVLEVSDELDFRLPEAGLKKLTKDGLNDYAAKIGLDAVNTSMTKSKMIADILKYQEGF